MARPKITPPRGPMLDRGLLLDQIPQFPFDDPDAPLRWVGEGVTWQPIACTRDAETIASVGSACDDTDFFDGDPIRECVAWDEAGAFTIKDRLQGSNLDLTEGELTGLLAERFAAMTSFVFANTLTSIVGGVETLPSNASAPQGLAFGSAAQPLYNVLAVFEAELARRQHGRAGIIHLTPGMLAHAITQYGVEWRDGGYYTPVGNLVTVDPGFYNADAPTGRAASGAGEEWVYASGWVAYRSSMVDLQQVRKRGVGARDHNDIVAFAQSFGILVFDQCLVTAALATYSND